MVTSTLLWIKLLNFCTQKSRIKVAQMCFLWAVTWQWILYHKHDINTGKEVQIVYIKMLIWEDRIKWLEYLGKTENFQIPKIHCIIPMEGETKDVNGFNVKISFNILQSYEVHFRSFLHGGVNVKWFAWIAFP